MKNNAHISIISPIYKSLDILDQLIEELTKEVTMISENYEIILVDDGNDDQSWDRIVTKAKLNNRLKAIKLSRNFGQHYAITAGINFSSGDYVSVIDGDLQQDPKDLIELYNNILKGYDIIFTKTDKREHSFIKNIFANLFYWIFNLLSSEPDAIGGPYHTAFTMFNRNVANEYSKIKDSRRHHLNILRFIGLKTKTVTVRHNKRPSGKTSYDTRRLINHALDAILFNTDRVLKAITLLGFFISFLSFISILYIFGTYILHGYLTGWPSIAVLILFSLGSILFCTGIIGLYVGRTFEQTKSRPLYIIQEKINFKV